MELRIHFHLFSFVRFLRHCLPVSRSLSTRWSEKEEARRAGLESTEMESKGKKGWYRGCRGGEEPTVRNDARRRRGKPATSQPDCKTLYNTKREKRESGRLVRLPRPIFCHPLSQRLPSKGAHKYAHDLTRSEICRSTNNVREHLNIKIQVDLRLIAFR